jgi:hypothetical protein
MTGCDNGADTTESEFKSSELTIPASDLASTLNTTDFLRPFSVKSSDEAVARAELGEDALVIRSTGSGSATIRVCDYRCENNAAHIELTVAESGAITEQVYHPFEGELVQGVVKEAVTISGTKGRAITPRSIKLMLDNNDFTAVTKEADLSDWIANLPGGLTAKAEYVQAGAHIHEVTLKVSGTPTDSCNERVRITIPSTHTAMQVAVHVDPNTDALFAIND